MANLTDTLTVSEIKKINIETEKLLSKLKMVQKSLSGINQEVDDLQNGFTNVLDTLASTKPKEEQETAKETSWRQLFLEDFSKELKKEIKDVYQESVEKYLSYLGSRPILNLASAGIESLFGNSAAKSALTFMLEPILSSAVLPIAGAAITAKYSWEMAKETADLTEKIDELGEEEGRKAAGTDLWDKAALYQYDTQKADFDVLYAGVSSKWEEFVQWWNENVTRLFSVETWQEFGNNIQTVLVTKWGEFVEWWTNTGFYEWWTRDVAPYFSLEEWQILGSNIQTALATAWEGFNEWWKSTGIYKWWTEDVVPFFSENNWNFDGITKGLSTSWQGAIESIKLLWNQFAVWLNEKLTIRVDVNTVLGKQIYDLLGTNIITIGSLPTFEVGGFPEDGLFMANHSELIGRFSNGKTVVANNEQIILGIKGGVKEAVSEVLTPYLADIAKNTRETADKDFSTYIGDKEIARASERGRRAMGMPLITEI